MAIQEVTSTAKALYRNHGCRVKEYAYQNQRLLLLENEFLSVGVLADKGADIFEFLYKPTDTEFLLHAPRGIRTPVMHSPSPTWGTFLDYYEGGWQEILPNGGTACTYKGIEFGFHDEISTIPWEYHVDANTPDEVQVTLGVRPSRTPFHLRRSMTLRTGEPVLVIDETLTNEGSETMEFMWGHHPAFGAPFLSPDCRVDLPAGDLILETCEGGAGTRLSGGRHRWPVAVNDSTTSVDFSRPDPPGSGHEDMGYVVNLTEGWYAITNQSLKVGFAMTWPLEVFPYLWVWRQFNKSAGYPWYGQVYTMALEPWSSYPSAGLLSAIRNNTAAKLEKSQSVSVTLRAVAYRGLQLVSHVTPNGEVEA
jgi:galactose mutarotase-like enzyme